MTVVGVGEEEDGFLKVCHLIVHLMGFDMRLELSEVVHSTLAVGGGDNICWVLANVLCDFSPSSLDGLDGVGEGAVHVKEDSVDEDLLRRHSCCERVSSG